jgi:hypothetical protein
VTILNVNDAPTINSVPNLTVDEDVSLQSLSLTGITAGPGEVGDANQDRVTITARAADKGSDPNSPVNNVLEPVTGTTRDLAVAPASVIGAADPQSVTLTFRPKVNAFGTSVVTVTVQDNGGTSNDGSDKREISFEVTVREVNDAPQFVNPFQDPPPVRPGEATAVVPITISDEEDPTGTGLRLSFSSSNPNLVSNVSTSFSETGSGQNRGVIVRTLPDAFGTADITVTLTDQGKKSDGSDVKSVTRTFKVTVTAGNAPTISALDDVTIPKDSDSPIMSFTVNDAQTPVNQLTVFGTSSNQTLVPDGNIQFGGSGGNRALVLRPAAGRSGSAIIRVTVRDADGNTNFEEFTITVLGEAPTITAIDDRTNLPQGGSTGSIAFQINDVETFPAFLTVTGTSANKTLVPDSNIFLGGSGQNRTVNVVLAANQTGFSEITLRVTDGEGQSATETFVVGTTAPVQDLQPPTISAIPNQETIVNRALPIISFTVGDDATPAGDLRLTATSSNAGLVPQTAIFFGGAGESRTVLITPAADQTGTSTIIITVTDASGKTASRSFTVTVRSGEPEPSVANDFNNDRLPDIILQDDGGFLAAWFMSGDDVLSSSFLSPNGTGDSGWKAIGTGDFNKDNKTDLLFQHPDSSLAVWYMDGVTLTSAAFINPVGPGTADWQAAAAADFNKDGNSDILFQHTDGSLAVWYLNGVDLISAAFLNPSRPSDPRWRVVATGDINRDTDVDLVFQLDDGTLGVWYLRGASLLAGGFTNPDNSGADWRVVGSTDLNQDGRIDLLLQNRATSDTGVWYMNGPNLISGGMIMPAGGTWKIVAP